MATTSPIGDMASQGKKPFASLFTPGQELLQGRLIIGNQIGKGGMGVVYRARDTLLNRDVAVKTLSRLDAGHLYQLKREFRTLAGFSHPNLVQLYELKAIDDTWLLIMELVDGIELGAWLQQKPSRDRILRVFAGLLDALRTIHAAGHMHRDVKPSNVMVKSDDHAVLLDFGLAVPITGSLPTIVAGTLAYMAPEQLTNDSPGPPADWYSFGVALFQALTGILPFPDSKLLSRKRRPPSVRAKNLVPDLPDALDETIHSLLDPNPQQRPGAEELAAVLGTTSRPRLAPLLRDSPFVARSKPLRRLHAIFHEVRLGQTKLAVVSGPSGIGKSALVRQFVKEVAAGSAGETLVLEGRCHPQESVPYKALDALIDNLVRHLITLDYQAVLGLAPRHAGALVRMFPVLGRVPGVRQWYQEHAESSPSELRRRGSSALRDLIGRLADRHPLILWIDDFQWSDDDSAPVLRELLSPPDAPRLLLILSSRDEPRVMATLLNDLGLAASRIELEPLTTEEIIELAHALAPAFGMDQLQELESIARESDGSPLFLGEWIQHRRDLGIDESSRHLPTGVAALIHTRLKLLSDESRRLIEVISIAGRPLELDLALDAAGLGGDGRLLTHYLCRESLLRVSVRDEKDYLETYHDRIRESVIVSLETPRWRSIHLRLAEGIRRSRNPDSRELVEHYLAADDRVEAARFVLLAAEKAERDLALDLAANLYELAMDLRPDVREDMQFLEHRANALANAARRDEAGIAYEQAAGAILGEQGRYRRTLLRGQAAEQYFCGGDLRNGLRALDQVLKEVNVHVPAGRVARILKAQWFRTRFLWRGSRVSAGSDEPAAPQVSTFLDALWRTTRGVVMLDHTLADVLAGRHLLEALRSRDTSRILRALGLESAFEANIGGPWFWTRSRKLLDEADRLAARTGDAYDFAWVTHCRASCAWFEGRWGDCVAIGSKAAELFQEQKLSRQRAGIAWDLSVQYGFILSALALQGKLCELSALLVKLIADAKRRKDNYSLRVFQTGDAVLHWLAKNDSVGALAEAEKTLQGVPGGHFTSQHRHHLVATVLSHLYDGDPLKAWDGMNNAWRPLRRAGFLSLHCLGAQLRYLHASSALALARMERYGSDSHRALLRVAKHDAKRIRRSVLPMAAPMADAVDAGVAGVLKQRDSQIAALRSAIAGFDAAGMALHREAARLYLSQLAPDGDDLREESINWMSSQGVVDAASMARAIIPPS